MKRFLLPAFLIAALFSAPVTSQAASDGPGRKKARTAKAVKKQAVAAPKPTSAANWGSTADDDALWATPAAAAPASAVAPAAPALNDDPAMHSSGVMIAPGMNTAPYRGVSTDYNGRPLNKPAKKVVAMTAPVETEVADDPMMHSSGVMIAPGMNTAPYRGVSTDYNGRPLKKKVTKTSTLASKATTATSVATATVPQW